MPSNKVFTLTVAFKMLKGASIHSDLCTRSFTFIKLSASRNSADTASIEVHCAHAPFDKRERLTALHSDVFDARLHDGHLARRVPAFNKADCGACKVLELGGADRELASCALVALEQLQGR